MKRKFSIGLILSICFIILIIIGGMYVHGQGDDVKFEEITYLGDISACNGVSIDITSKDQYFKNEIRISFNEGLNYQAKYESLFHEVDVSNPFDFFRLNFSLYRIQEEHSRFENKEGTFHYLVSDYYDYLPISFELWNSEHYITTESEINKLLQVSVPEDAEVVYENDKNTSSTNNKNIPSISNDLPKVKIGDYYYFTIPNLELTDTKYRGISGILVFDVKQDSLYDNKIDKTIKVLYPIEISSDKKVQVLNIAKVTNANYIALAVLEDNNLYLYLYDLEKQELITKKKVGETPENATIKSFEFIEQGDILLANYLYNMNRSKEESTLFGVVAVYEFTKENEIKVHMESEYLRKLPKELKDRFIYYNNEFFYHENKVFLLSRNYDYEINNGFKLIAFNDKEILYAGMINGSMNEEYTIGQQNTKNQHVLTDYSNRTITRIGFVK